jgi:hypothetical protein
MTEEEKFKLWFEQEKKKGLIDMEVCRAFDKCLTTTTREELFKELNFFTRK